MTTQKNLHADTSIRPQDDFFHYVNNSWIQANPIPASESRWGTFHILRDIAWNKMRVLYESLADDNTSTGVKQQARDFYYTGMHFNELSEQHYATVATYLEKIDTAINTSDLSYVVGELHRIGVNVPWALIIDSDEKDSKKYVTRLYQAGLSLPDQDYYLETSDAMKTVRTKYKTLLEEVVSMFKLGEGAAESIVATEMAIARAQRTNSELRDVEKNYNPITFTELKSTYPNINWERYAEAAYWEHRDNISHDQPEFIAMLNTAFTEEKLQEWKTYFKWQVVRKFLPYISDETAELAFSFFGKVISGTTENMPLWKRVVLTIDRAMGENAGRLYVEKHFPETAKKEVLSLVDEVTRAFIARIGTLEWMSEKTKQYAIKKLGNMKVLIGYPDEWRDFSHLRIGRTSLVDNIIATEIFNHDYELAQLNKPNDREKWYMSPQTVNAYHDPNRLVICFPAGILQAPFYDLDATPAENLSGIGAVIGHELTHGFDDQGCQFDADGNVKQWQSDEERQAFAERAKIIIDQADEFEVLPDVYLKGDLVIGESIADLGGVELALEALRKRFGDGLTKQHLTEYFMNFAFCEAGMAREEKTREFALTDPHPPSIFRVNAVLQHIDAFYDVFDVAQSDVLYRAPEHRARIW